MYSKKQTTNKALPVSRKGTLVKQIRYDLTIGLLQVWPKYLPAAAIFLIPVFQLAVMVRAENSVGTFTLGDTILYTFSGMTVYEPAAGDPFTIPVIWLLMNLYLAYVVGSYPARDLHGYGQQILLRSRRRGQWWAGKCLWNLISVAVYYALGWLIMTVSSLILGGNMTLRITSELWKMLTWEGSEAEKALMLSAILLPPLCSAAVSLLQMAVMMIARPVIGYLLVACLFTASAYFYSPLLIGNASMMLRNESNDEGRRTAFSFHRDLLSSGIGFASQRLFLLPPQRYNGQSLSGKGALFMAELVIRNLSKVIHGATVLNNISLEMESGKVYGLRGKNGSGKTMLMRAICGLIVPSEGEIVINGEQLGKDISFPRSVGALIENPAFIPTYTGFRNLQILASIQGKINEEQIRYTLQEVGLDPEDKRKYKKYSLGMKQRLGIAAAIMERPRLVVLDEPLNALDEKGVEMMHGILRGLKEAGSLILIACHDREELDILADEIFIMEDGRVKGKETVVRDRMVEAPRGNVVAEGDGHANE